MGDMEDWVNWAFPSLFFCRDPVQYKWHHHEFHPLRKSSQLEVEFRRALEGHPGRTDQLLDLYDRTSVYVSRFFVFYLYLAARQFCSKRGGWCDGVVKCAWLGLPDGHVRWPVPVVLATGPGNPRAVQVLTGGSDWFGSRPGQKPNQLCLGGFVTRTGHRAVGIWPASNRTADPNIRFLLLWLQLSIWVLIVSWHSQYVNCSALAPLWPPASKFAIRLIFVEWLWNNGWF